MFNSMRLFLTESTLSVSRRFHVLLVLVLLVLVLLVLVLLSVGAPIPAQSTDRSGDGGAALPHLAIDENDREPELLPNRAAVDKAFSRDLGKIAQRLLDANRAEEAERVRAWAVPRAADRQYFFWGDLCPSDPLADLPQPFQAYLQRARQRQAARLWQLAKHHAASPTPDRVVAVLYEILREVPDHPEARAALGLAAKPRSLAWSGRGREGRVPHHGFGWRAGDYWRLSTDHFLITTNHSVAAAESLATLLERLWVACQQIHAGYFFDETSLRAITEGGRLRKTTRRKHQVVLFRDREEYTSYLRRWEPQAEMTLGIYRARDQKAYFYVGEDDLRPTWRHEGTHQLLLETRARVEDVGEEDHFWLVEGPPLYMESMVVADTFGTVGGHDAPRLQYARFRALQESFYEPVEAFTRRGRLSFQQDPHLRRLYSQAAGLAHLCMAKPEWRWRTLRFLRELYAGKAEQTFPEALGIRPPAWDEAYQAFLRLEDTDLDWPPHVHPRVLLLGGTRVSDEGLAFLARNARKLTWLDLSGCAVTDKGVSLLPPDTPLEKLALQATSITDASLPVLAGWTTLQELDLAQTSVTDAGLSHLLRLRQLRTLWLKGSQVSAAGAQSLSDLPALQSLDLASPVR